MRNKANVWAGARGRRIAGHTKQTQFAVDQPGQASYTVGSQNKANSPARALGVRNEG